MNIENKPGATIVSPATPGGEGAVSIVRLSGPRAFPILSVLTSRSPSVYAPRKLMRADVRDAAGNLIDAALAVCFPGPNSFTGEDVVEFHLHGSPVVVEAAIRAACAAGAVPAQPGEFSRRAFLNGKMDLTQAEGLADLIAARTQAAASSALRQMRGAIGREIAPIRESLVELLTALETAIDFGEEDIEQVAPAQICERVKEITGRLESLLGSYEKGRMLADGAMVAIAGVANVGKSLLLNRLAGEERAIVDDAPGTTRDFLQAEVTAAGFTALFVDTAGLRETADPVEQKGVERSRGVIARADLVLFVLDGAREVNEEDRQAYEEARTRPHLLLLNKSDLPAVATGAELAGAALAGKDMDADGAFVCEGELGGKSAGTGEGEGEGIFAGAGKGVIRISAKTGEGIDHLVEAVARELAISEGAVLAQAPLTRERHRQAVEKALEALARAGESASTGMAPEFTAADVLEASHALAELVGEIAPEEILNELFRRFCIGK